MNSLNKKMVIKSISRKVLAREESDCLVFHENDNQIYFGSFLKASVDVGKNLIKVFDVKEMDIAFELIQRYKAGTFEEWNLQLTRKAFYNSFP